MRSFRWSIFCISLGTPWRSNGSTSKNEVGWGLETLEATPRDHCDQSNDPETADLTNGLHIPYNPYVWGLVNHSVVQHLLPHLLSPFSSSLQGPLYVPLCISAVFAFFCRIGMLSFIMLTPKYSVSLCWVMDTLGLSADCWCLFFVMFYTSVNACSNFFRFSLAVSMLFL